MNTVTKTFSLLSALSINLLLHWAVSSLQVQVVALDDDAASSSKGGHGIRERYEALLTQTAQGSTDGSPDGMLLPFSLDGDCDPGNCHAPPDSTIETTRVQQQVCRDGEEDVCVVEEIEVDKHWGSDRRILSMRDKLRKLGSGTYDDKDSHEHPFDSNVRPPIFLMPGLAATRLVAWKHKTCPHSPLLSDIKFHDYVWLNMKLLVQMGTIAGTCWEECMTLGRNQTDSDNGDQGCKLRPDEGLDAIASLAPGSVGAELLVGQTNTLFAWLVQWLADNLGYDLSNIIGLPYDWRLSPHMMEKRDGFLSHTRRRIEAAVKANGGIPGIMVAHSVSLQIVGFTQYQTLDSALITLP
jgi:Lecithin:cholesterol acyltransferase